MIISSKPTHLSFIIFKPIFKKENLKVTKMSKEYLLKMNRNQEVVPHLQSKENSNIKVKQISTKTKKVYQTAMLYRI